MVYSERIEAHTPASHELVLTVVLPVVDTCSEPALQLLILVAVRRLAMPDEAPKHNREENASTAQIINCVVSNVTARAVEE